MKFRSNNRVAVHVPDLKQAEAFYTGVLGFRLVSKTATQLEYDTGRFLFCVNKAPEAQPPVPSFTVIDTAAARDYLQRNGCKVSDDRSGTLFFKDPFGFRFDVIED